MKKLFYTTLFLLLHFNISAQLRANLIVNTNPPAAIYQWATRADVLLLQVFPGQVQGVDNYKIKTEVKLLDGTVIGVTDLTKQTAFLLPRTNILHRANEVMPLTNLIFTNSYKTSIEQTGKLPANNYQICVTLVNALDFKAISETYCKPFFVQALQLPFLITPNNQTLNYNTANTTITFRWTPLLPRPNTAVAYKLLVFEVLPGQKTMQALRSNQPVASVLVQNATQYIWQPRGILVNPTQLLPNYFAADSATKQRDYTEHISFLNNTEKTVVPNSVYIWTIQTLDALGNPLTDASVSADAISQPAIFKIENSTVKKQ
jgi:hypothetical protein